MPQIAQQDYKIIAPTLGRAFENDAAALAELKKSVLNGIAFDCLLKNAFPDEGTLDRVIGIYERGSDVYAFNSGNGNMLHIELHYTLTQYQGLAAVQKEIDKLDGAIYDSIPVLQAAEGVLIEAGSGYAVCTPEGYQYKVTIEDGNIATIEASTAKTEGDFIAISIEDAQKLIGLPCES